MDNDLLEKIRAQRVHSPREQVRFWTSPELYTKFKEALAHDGVMFIQDAFTEFMAWYVNQPRRGGKNEVANIQKNRGYDRLREAGAPEEEAREEGDSRARSNLETQAAIQPTKGDHQEGQY